MAMEEPWGGLSWRNTFTALRWPNYRLWFLGQLISLLGTWMQSTAQGYLAFELTRSPGFLGTVAFATGVPSWIFMLYAGVIADRVSRRKMLIVAQLGMMAVSVVLAVLAFTGLIRAWHLVGLGFALGVANAFDAPARQAIVSDLVDHEDLGNAIALNSIMFNTATALGPAVGGLVYAWIGPGWCFAINALSFLGVLVALLLMRLPPHRAVQLRASALADLRQGLRYVARDRTILALVVIVAVVTVFGMSYVALLPAWAVKILHGDARTNGLLQSARGVGALGCALIIASLGRFRFKGRLLTLGTFLLPVSLLLFAVVRSVPLALLCLVGVGAALILCFTLANTLVQTLADDDLRGRVMGVYSFTFFGFLPVGGLYAGAMAEQLGEPWTVALGAALVFAAAATLRLAYPRLRRIE